MNYQALLVSIQQVHETALTQAASVVNRSLILRNWLIGAWLVEFEQNGDDRARYGTGLLKQLAKDLTAGGVSGCSRQMLDRMRLFYSSFPQLSTIIRSSPMSNFGVLPPQIGQSPVDLFAKRSKSQSDSSPSPLPPQEILRLSWTHIIELLAVDDPWKRAFYENECIKGNWSVRQLQRQIGSLLYERTGLSTDKQAVIENARQLAPDPRRSHPIQRHCNMINAIPLPGCRHDILGHHLKAWGILRALHQCSAPEHCDPEAEGWWDLENACFMIRSTKYDTFEKLTEFFAVNYQPTIVITPWDKDIGYKANAAPFPHQDDLALANTLRAQIPEKDGAPVKRKNYIEFRDKSKSMDAQLFDSIAAIFVNRHSDNPVFLSRGSAGRAQMFRTYWEYIESIQKERSRINGGKSKTIGQYSLNGMGTQTGSSKGKGSPFFPDAIKTYNNGSGWVVESFPFNALDYVLAVEGALSLRGSASRTLAANSRRFAAFPFIFETGENMTDDSGEIKDTGKALWLPLWDRPATYTELASFICDAQSRLPGKEARFSSEFARALRSQGVDAGFSAWQEFRYKMKASRIPWVCTGTYIGQASTDIPLCLTDALSHLDESAFLNQFNESWKGAKIENSSPHTFREAINTAIEATAASPSPENALDILVHVFKAVKQLTLSKSLRDKTHGAHFFKSLPYKPWNKLLEGLASHEFQIARALATITGQEKQPDNSYSVAQPMLGSILPLKLGFNGWYLPTKSSDLSNQAVWTGYDLYHDLCLVLQRRYLDSLSDQLPALRAVHPAPLPAILALLKGELDTQRILRWTEALSLIGWHFDQESNKVDSTETGHIPAEAESTWISQAIPTAYAAARSLLEAECEWQGSEPALWVKRRSRIPFALLCQRSPHAVDRSVAECLHWLAVWGVKNPDKTTRNEAPRLRGKWIIKPDAINITPEQASRLAAAVCVPLDWRDQFPLYREITIPSKTQPKGKQL